MFKETLYHEDANNAEIIITRNENTKHHVLTIQTGQSMFKMELTDWVVLRDKTDALVKEAITDLRKQEESNE